MYNLALILNCIFYNFFVLLSVYFTVYDVQKKTHINIIIRIYLHFPLSYTEIHVARMQIKFWRSCPRNKKGWADLPETQDQQTEMSIDTDRLHSCITFESSRVRFSVRSPVILIFIVPFLKTSRPWPQYY